jgi:WD40 repeat protein
LVLKFKRMKYLYFFLIAVVWHNFSFGQEVKLGLPVGHSGPISFIEYSPNEKLLITITVDGSSKIWDTSSGKCISILQDSGLNFGVKSVSFNYNGSLCSIEYKSGWTSYWETASGLFLKSEMTNPTFVDPAKGYHREFQSKQKVKLLNDSILQLDMDTLIENRLIYLNHTEKINCFLFSNSGNYIVTGSNDNTAKIWNTADGTLIHSLDGNQNLIDRIEYSLNEERFLTTFKFESNIARIWETKTGRLISTLQGHSERIRNVNFNSDGSCVVSSSEDKTAKVWNANNGELLFTLVGHTKSVNSVNYNQNNDKLLTSSGDGTFRIWSAIDGKIISISKKMSNGFISARYSPDEMYILTSSEDGKVRIWDSSTLKILKTIKGNYPFFGAFFTLDGKNIVLINSTKKVQIYDIGKGLITYEFYSPDFEINYNKIGKNLNPYEFGEILRLNAVISPKNEHIVIGTRDKIVNVYDLKSGRLIYSLNELMYEDGWLESFQLCSKGKYISVVLNTVDESRLLFFDFESGKKLLQRYFVNKNECLSTNNEGHFDASPEAMELMYWTKGLEVIEFAQLKDRYWVPGLWEKVMKGEPLPDARNMQELKLQPEVKLGEVKDGKIPVTLTKREGGYGKVSILINGKEIQADARGTNFDKTKETQTIWVDLKDHPNLQDGENTIAVKASSEDGFVVGRPEEKKVTMSFQTAKPHFYAVVVGTGKYMNSSINLKYPEKDAESMAKALQLGSEKLFGKENTHIYTLTTSSTERPTKEKIKSVFTEIGKTAKSSDVVLVYLSGHGIAWGGDQGDFYYVTTDATAANAETYNDEALRKNYTVSTTEFTEYLKAIPANKQVMIIDACGSGKAVDNLMAARDIDVSSIKAIDRMKDRTGMFVISGSSADAVSYEASRYGQGLLTYSILQAMKGAALRDGQFFDVNTILNYSRENVPRLAAGIGGIQTPQLLVPKGGSFDIGKVDSLSKIQIPLSSIKPVFVRTVVFDDNSDDDDLNLSKLLDEQLNETAMRGKDAQLVFLDTREFPDAYRLRGSYTQSNGTITLQLKIKGPKESEHTLIAATKEELVEMIIELVEMI